jgi:hypothetical protein
VVLVMVVRPLDRPACNEASDKRAEDHGMRCSRCAEYYYGCPHVNTLTLDMSTEEATRVRARYAFGKLHNPDHDTTSYRDTAQPHPMPCRSD